MEVSKDYVVITWEPPTCDGGEKISGYEVEKSLDGMIFVSAGYVDSSVLRHKIIRLHDGYDYIFRVSAENRIGLGDPVTLEKPVTCKLPFGEQPYFLFGLFFIFIIIINNISANVMSL